MPRFPNVWLDFQQEARSSFESAAPALAPGAMDKRGWPRVWALSLIHI